MKDQVFKLPDGRGGTVYKIMDADGAWIDCDEGGTPLPPANGVESRPGQEPARRKDRFSRTAVNVYFTSDVLQAVNDYTSFRSLLVHGKASRSEIIQEAIRDFISRDEDFQRFMRMTDHGYGKG